MVAVLLATGLASVLIFALFVFPGVLATGSGCADQESFGNRDYCAENVPVYDCLIPSYGCGPGESIEFQSVTFEFALYQDRSGGSPALDGSVIVSNQTSYRFGLVGYPIGESSLNWTSLDRSIVVEWSAPFLQYAADGQPYANVTCAVIIPEPGP